MLRHLQRFILLCVLPISGCATMTASIDPNYNPQPGSTSPLQTIRPLNIVLQVEDQRPSSEQNRLGDRRNGFGNVMAGVNSNRSAPLIVHDALAAELKNNGHVIVDAQSQPADRIVQVSVKKCWTENRVHFFEVAVAGSIVSDITIIDPRTTAVLVSRPISGNSIESYQIATQSSYEEALNKALLEFVRSFARDSQILNALNTTSPQR
jgi:uncharacterized lipoprotein YajG